MRISVGRKGIEIDFTKSWNFVWALKDGEGKSGWREEEEGISREKSLERTEMWEGVWIMSEHNKFHDLIATGNEC